MKKIFVNLKDYLSLEENATFSENVRQIDVVLFPSLPFLYLYKDNEIGVQDVSYLESGAHTGLVSIEHLKDFDIKWAIINHRENPCDKKVMELKISACINNQISPLICFKDIEELNALLSAVENRDDYTFFLAYEPDDEKELSVLIQDIKNITNIISFKNIKCHLIYGGSITADNIKYYENLDVYGLLISRGAIKVEDLKAII